MGTDLFPFAEAKPRIRGHANDFLFHDDNPLSKVVDTFQDGRMLNSVVCFAREPEIPVSTFVAGGRSTGTGCKFSARLQMTLTLTR